MRIDATHRPWLFLTVAAIAIATAIYLMLAVRSLQGPRGGNAIGLAFGIAGYGMMLFAGFLGFRKKFPTVRIGRAQTWMRGHLWLGLLSFPLILFHAGFALGGPLTAVLMILFVIVAASGVIGAALQHYLPSVMTTRVPLETIYEEIPHVREQLLAEADQLVEAVVATEKTQLREVYHAQIRPHLEQPRTEMFAPLRASLPATLHPVLDDLADICEEQRQLNRQVRLYHWMHAWLLVHVPLSILLLVLGGVHAIMALRY
jgi:hypothetical protein